MLVTLRVQSGSNEGREIPVAQDKFLIGRAETCQLRPKSESVSRKHCILVIQEGRLLIQDLHSRNGTFLNEKRLPVDKAKVIQDGDILRIGKLVFRVGIQHGLTDAKKPEVTSVGDAATRTVQRAARDDSKFEEVDVTSWLDEADQIDRVRKLTDPDTRQFVIGDVSNGAESDELSVSETEAAEGVESGGAGSSREDSAQLKIPDKKGKTPGKLPPNFKQALKENSRDAADDALKRFFSGR